MTTRAAVRCIVGAVVLGGMAAPAQTYRIDLGTVAPKESPWHEVLLQMGQDWRRISGGKVQLRIFAGGVQGDEVDMLRRMRAGQLQAVAFSGVGLAHVEPAVGCLSIPLMLDSYEELDHVRERIAPRLEAALAAKGYIVLNWGDVGWVHFFANQPVKTLDEIRKLKLFITAGDPAAEKLYKDFGFRPIPLASTDLRPALATKTVDAFDVPPLFALLEQLFPHAPNMIALKWAPLIGGTLVRKKEWEEIPEKLRGPLLEAARKAGDKMRDKIRKLGDEAIVQMQKRKLNVIQPDEKTMALWRRQTEEAYPKLRGKLVAADLFDEVKRLRDEYREARAAAAKPPVTTGQLAPPAKLPVRR